MDNNVVNNFVKVTQEHKHVVVKGAGGLRGVQGPAGAGLQISGSVATYADLPWQLTIYDAGKAYFVQADGLLYVWTGERWPNEGDGAEFVGPQGSPGYSPQATVTKVGDTATITITDRDGTTTATVSDGTIPVIDDSLSLVSENPVQNKVVTSAINGKQATLQAGDITTSLLADESVTEQKLADGSVTTSKIGSQSVTEGIIADGAVTTDKLGSAAVTSNKIDWATITTTSDTSSVVLPNSADIKGWRITLACLCEASNNAGTLVLKPSTNLSYTRHSWTWTSSIVSDLKEGWNNQGANTGPSLLRGGSTGGKGYNTSDITLMKQGTDNIGFSIHTAYVVYDYSALYNSRVLGGWKVADNNAAGLTLTFSKGTTSEYAWAVVPITA